MAGGFNCPKCGAALQENAQFCPYCMTSFAVRQEIPKGKEIKPKRTRRIIAASVAAAVLLIIAGIAVYIHIQLLPVCLPSEFRERVPIASEKLGVDELWDISTFESVRSNEKEGNTEYSINLNLGDSFLSLFFYNDAKEVSAVVWDVEEQDVEKAQRLIACITDTYCNNFFTDIDKAFLDNSQYPHEALETPFERYFTEGVGRTDIYNRFIENGGTISTDCFDMNSRKYLLSFYKTRRSDSEKTLYDIAVYIEKI